MLKSSEVRSVKCIQNFNELKTESLIEWAKKHLNFKEFLMYMPVKDEMYKIPRSYILDVSFIYVIARL